MRPRPSAPTPMWAKLCAVMLCANLAGFIIAILVARTVRAVPDSGAVETALLFAYYGTMLLVGIVDALLLDEVVFHGAFRRTHLQGRDPRYAKADADVGELAATMQRSSLSFPIAVLLSTVVTYGLFNRVNRGFDDEYKRVGRHVSTLQHGSEAERIEAVQALAILRGPYFIRSARALLDALEQDGPVAAWAAWGLGRMEDRDRKRPFVAPLAAVLRSGDTVARREALIALGRLQHRASADAIVSEVEAIRARGDDVDPRLLYALGAVQTMSSVDVLVDLLHTGSPSEQGLAAWALAQHRGQEGAREAIGPVLASRLGTASARVQCDIVHAMTIFADESFNIALMSAYDHASPAQRAEECPRRLIEMRPDGSPGDRKDLFLPQDTFAMKTIAAMAQIRATAPELRRHVEPWLERIIADEGTLPGPKEAARTLLAGIRAGRDDSDRPSVDQALGLH